MASYAETRRIPLDMAAATRACAEAVRRLGPELRIEIENPAFGLVVASRPASGRTESRAGERSAGAGGSAADGKEGMGERIRWELWPVEPAVTEARLQIETEGVGFFARGRLKETADWLFGQVGAPGRG